MTTDRLARAPVSRVSLWNGRTAWLITRHADQVALLRDGRISADNTLPGYPSTSAGSEAARAYSRSFISMDNPEHNNRRRAYMPYFTVKNTRRLAPRIQHVIDGLLDALEQQGPPADLVPDFALPLPSLVICELLGVPYRDHAFFQRASTIVVDTRATPEAVLAISERLVAYLSDLIEYKLNNPGDDLLSRITSRQIAAGVSTKEECATEARLLLIAGHATTANMVALGICVLLQHPEQLAVVRDGTCDQVANAVEELLRYLTIFHLGQRRVALEPIEIGGVRIAAGDAVICAGAAANRDPAVFEDPDRLDVGRPARRHLAFGSGPHQCLGQNLARVELQLAYPALFRRFPGLRLDCGPDDIPFKTAMAIYGIHRLPVTW
ncbi:cytochrome P450 [Streptomyces sp. NPDC059785]|uniref:cytochrome P450 n=1 Tax=Streptomyces sp. NPDC059785 TaxID=3346945 RepID=UPI00364BF2C9